MNPQRQKTFSFLMATALIAIWLASPAEAAETKMTFYLNFSTPYGDHIAAYLALRNGYFKDQGLDVTIQTTGGSNDCVKVIGARKDDVALGVADSLAVLQGAARGIPLTSLSAVYQSNASCIISLKKKNIRAMKDLVGKTLADAPASTTYYFIKAGLAKANLDFNQVKFLAVENRAKDAILMTEKADAIGGMVNGQAVNIAEKGHEINLITTRDMGIQGYGICLIANNNFIKNDVLIHKFMEAYIKGIRFQREKPEEAAILFQKDVPLRTVANIREQNRMNVKLMESEDASQSGFGHQTEEAWNTLQDILYENKVIEKKTDVTKMFTNRFMIPATKEVFK